MEKSEDKGFAAGMQAAKKPKARAQKPKDNRKTLESSKPRAVLKRPPCTLCESHDTVFVRMVSLDDVHEVPKYHCNKCGRAFTT